MSLTPCPSVLQDLSPLKVSPSYLWKTPAVLSCSSIPTLPRWLTAHMATQRQPLRPAPAAGGCLWLWEHGGPCWGGVWVPGRSQLQMSKSPRMMPPSLPEALAEAIYGSTQKGRNAPFLFPATLCHLDTEAFFL